MPSLHTHSDAFKHRTRKSQKIRRNKTPAERRIDLREQLCNGGECGPLEQVQLPEAMITSLRGILLDFDPSWFRTTVVPQKVRNNPVKFFTRSIRKMLARNSVLAKAEVRVSGRGLHVIIRFRKPIEFTTDADREHWACIVKVVQRLLPTDPDCPGITAVTRAIGSINSKNGAKVRRLRPGKPVEPEEVIALFEQARTSPFRTIARLLFGDEHVKPCPICHGPNSKLDALDRVGICYGSCGTVRIGQLFDLFLQPRATKAKE